MTRQALLVLLDSYLEALRLRQPERLDLGRLLRFTENGQELAVGDGLWASVDAVADQPFAVVIDELNETLVALIWVEETGVPVVLSIRMAVSEGRITELETVVSRWTICPFPTTTMVAKAFERRHMFDSVLPPEQRVGRKELARAANLYLDSIERGVGEIIPVTEDAVRWENGQQMTRNPTGEGFPSEFAGNRRTGSSMTMADVLGMSVAEQMDRSVLSDVIACIRDRRFAAVDEARGTIAMFFVFDHRQNVADPRKLATIPHPNCCYSSELFKVVDGKITHIEAGFELVPFGAVSGWS